MPKVIISRNELPIPVSDHINKLRFRVVNDNRNIFSDWSVINHIYQVELDPNSRDGLPPGGNPGEVLVPIPIDPVDNWDIGWVPVGTWAEDNGLVTVDDIVNDLPPGGTIGQVLTKISNDDYLSDWEDLPPTPSPDEVNFAVGISMFA